MKTSLLLSIVKMHGDTQEDLAIAIGISRTRLSAKLHARNGASFTQPEIAAIKKRYSMSDETLNEVFFS